MINFKNFKEGDVISCETRQEWNELVEKFNAYRKFSSSLEEWKSYWSDAYKTGFRPYAEVKATMRYYTENVGSFNFTLNIIPYSSLVIVPEPKSLFDLTPYK